MAEKKARRKPEKVNFTKAAIEALPVPATGRMYYFDKVTPGLAIAVMGTGKKTFYVYKRVKAGDRKPIRVSIGRWPGVTVQVARAEASKILGQIAGGENPQEQRRLSLQEPTLGDLWETFLEQHAKPHKKSWHYDEGLWGKHLEPWRNRKLSRITHSELKRLHIRIGKDAPIAANRLIAFVSAMFNKTGRDFDVTENPAKGITKFQETSRERFLDRDELERLFQALEAEADQDWREFFLVLLLTGARSGNVQSMRWQNLDLVHGLWRVPGTESKNKSPLAIVLTDPVVSLLRTRRERLPDEEWVFPCKNSRAKAGHVGQPKCAWKRIAKQAGLADVHVHDLRRTMASWQAALGASLLVIGKSLGHKSQQATLIYSRLNMDPVRQSVAAATTAMLAAAMPKRIEDGQPAEVVEQDGNGMGV